MNDEEWVKTRNFKMLNYVFIKKSKKNIYSKKLISSLSNSIQCYVPRRTFNQWRFKYFKSLFLWFYNFNDFRPKVFFTLKSLKVSLKGNRFTIWISFNFQLFFTTKCQVQKLFFEEFWILLVPFVLK